MSAFADYSVENLFELKSLQSIVDDVGALVQHDLVISSSGGVIIAATSRDRIGLMNPEVQEMIQTNGDYHIVQRGINDSVFRPGINLPIRYENQSVGAVGVTGEPEEVKEIAALVRAMVQLQLHDLAYQANMAERKRIISDFVYNWFHKATITHMDEFMLRSRSLGLDLNVPRIIFLMDCRSHDSDITDSTLDQTANHIYDFIEKKLTRQNEKHIVTMLDSRITVLLCGEDEAEAEKIITDCQNSVYERFGVLCAVGSSSAFHHFENAKNRYMAARQACKVSMAKADKPITMFHPYDLEMLVFSMSEEKCLKFYSYFFRKYKSTEQIQEDIKLLSLYIRCNRSIAEVAQNLNMHKNTVQCHLDKFQALTGYNPRNARDLAYISLIITIGKNLVENKT